MNALKQLGMVAFLFAGLCGLTWANYTTLTPWLVGHGSSEGLRHAIGLWVLVVVGWICFVGWASNLRWHK